MLLSLGCGWSALGAAASVGVWSSLIRVLCRLK
jgi:hypothetical protein